MRARELNNLQSERNQLIDIISRIPEGEIINKVSFENRLDKVDSEIEKLQQIRREPAKTVLYFRGKPVIGSLGIVAEFGLAAVKQFNDAITALVAKMSGTSLGDRGPIPDSKENQLLITGTALGSFGFELEENLEQYECFSQSEDSLMEKTMKKAVRILRASIGSDDDLMDEIEELDDRSLKEIHDFLKIMADHEAYCTIEVDEDVFCFDDSSQVERSAKRLTSTNIQETENDYKGEFIGVLPESRTFEFKTSPDNTIIKGKVGPQIVDAMKLNHILETQVKIVVHSKIVGKGNPRLTLLSYIEL